MKLPVQTLVAHLFLFANSLVALSAQEPSASHQVEVVLVAGAVSEPFSVIFDQGGTMYGVEFTKANRIFKRTSDGQVTFIAGVKAATNEKELLPEVADGPGAQARFHGMHDLCFTDGEKSLLVADTFNHRIRKVDLKSGTVSTVVGTGKPGYNGNSQRASAAQLNLPICISAAPKAGQFWITDLANQRVRIFDERDGKVHDAVGNGQKGKVNEGVGALLTPLNGPRATTGDGNSTWVVLREGNSLVQSSGGKLRTILNGGGKAGYSEGPTPLDVQLKGPKFLCQDAQGNVIICDTENHVVRRFLPKENKVELLMGTPGKAGNAVGGTGREMQWVAPGGKLNCVGRTGRGSSRGGSMWRTHIMTGCCGCAIHKRTEFFLA
jgi:sugar lactone lactonase YvrE